MAKVVLNNAAQFRIDDSTKIDLLSSEIEKKIYKNCRIIDATLILQAATVTGSGFEVKIQSNEQNFEVIDYILPSSGDTVFLNITEELNDIIKNPNDAVVIQFDDGITFNSDIELKVEYIPEHIMHESNEYYEVDAGRAGSGKINIATGALNFVHSDSAASGISHVYNTWQANKAGADFDYPDIATEVKEAIGKYGDYGCGKGWKLNVHQYLVKREKTSEQDLYTYVDGNGNYHEFSEKYYYMGGEVKIYLDKEAVNVGFDGKLTYEGMEVKPELITTGGLILQTNYKGFSGAEKLELRSEDCAKIEEDIEQLKRTISDCLFAFDEYTKAETEEYKALVNLQEKVEDYSVACERQSLESQNLVAEIMGRDNGNNAVGGLFAQKEEFDFVLEKNTDGTYKRYPGNAFELEQSAYETALSAFNSAVATVAKTNANAIENIDISKGATRIQLQEQNNATDALNTAQTNLNAAQKIFNTKIDLLQQTIREMSNQIEQINWDESEKFNSAKKDLLDLQDDFRDKKRKFDNSEENRQTVRNQVLYKRAKDDIKKARHLLEFREFELSILKAQEPVRFITGDEGLIMGFNEAGVLMVIADAYENATYMNYEDGKLISITNTDSKETKFEYEDGYLIRIIDADEQVIRFDYFSNGTLAAILYPDATSSDFNYIWESGLLSTITNPSGYGVKFSYDNQKVTKIEETTQTYEITDDGWRGFNSEEEEKEYKPRILTEIKYNTHFSSTLTDRFNNKKTYIFDILGKPATVYEGEYAEHGENTKSLSIDYSGAEQTFSITDNILYDNILKKTNGIQLKGELPGNFTQASHKVYDINISDLPEGVANLVFSAWAKADSAFVPSERKTGYSISKADDQSEKADIFKKRRKFGLRAELEFIDNRNVVTREEFSASFDWLNIGWQYLALPIAIREDDKIGDRIVAKFPFKLGSEDRRLTKLKVIIDYSYNVNGRYDGRVINQETDECEHIGMFFDCATLREGDWTYSKIEPDGKTNYTEESATGNTTFYDYDKNGNMIKETIKDKQYRNYINTYEYNKQNALIRSTDYCGLCKETIYDDKGRTVKTITYNIADPTSKFYDESVIDEKGKVTADIDITGKFNSAEYEFDHTGAVKAVKDALGNKTAFGYHNDNLVSISGDCNGEENKNTFKHTLGFTTKVSSDGTDYTYTYDGWGRQKTVSVAGEKYASIEYLDDYTTETTLASGEKFKERSDAKDAELSEYTLGSKVYKGKAERTYYTSANGNETLHTLALSDEEFGSLTFSLDKGGEIEYTTAYEYDKNGRLIGSVEDSSGFLQGIEYVGIVERDIEYNDNGGIKYNKYEVNGVTQSYSYEHENAVNDRQVTITLPSGTKQEFEYDGLGRMSSVSLSAGSQSKYTKDIYYAKFGDHATNYVSSVWYGVDGKRDENTRYTYDKKGNIVSVKENGKDTVRYAYDSLDRLIREDNKTLKKTEIYQYDNNGNIVAKATYPYTLSDNPTGVTPIEYKYPQSGWCDQLLSYNGEKIEYDTLGNPTHYRSAIKNMTWSRGGNLAEYGGITYTYNAVGVRTSKTVGNITTIYYLDGARILAEERRDSKKSSNNLIETLYYHYGADGVTGFEHRKANETKGTIYVYRKSAQGDITHIYTEGAEVVRYAYDAWGNHEIRVKADADNKPLAQYAHLATLNPLRYRGYYFDGTIEGEAEDSGFYYLNSRYYDPAICRFINADDISELDPEEINGLNLYAYCGDNPIMNVDPNGRGFISFLLGLLICGLVFAVVNVGVQLVGDIINFAMTGTWSSGWEEYLGAFIGGFVGGVVFAMSGGNFAFAFGAMGFTQSFTTNLLTNATGKTDYSGWAIFGQAVAMGALGFAVGKFAKVIKIPGITAGKNSFLSVFKGGITKLLNGTAGKIALKVIGKGIVGLAAYRMKSALMGGALKTVAVDWILKQEVPWWWNLEMI
ncbi:MAG: hypothetical protein FWH03_08260 [Firmicutes bacterium]|nr:hypothetical protein [Bacillota bacterium]